jgi:hypothetical protein
MRGKISELFELQLYKSLKTIEKKNNLKYNDLFNHINNNLIELKSIQLEKKKDISILISDKLNYLINDVPDFTIRNKTLTSMTECFIKICKKDNIDTSSINEASFNSMLITWVENQM